MQPNTRELEGAQARAELLSPADDLLRGVKAIAEFIGEEPAKANYQIARGYLPVTRRGRLIFGSKDVLRRHVRGA